MDGRDAPRPMPLSALCVFIGGIVGTIKFSQMDPAAPCFISYEISGLPGQAKHGFHVHEYGDIRDNCTKAGAHLNPWDQPHAGPDDEYRHMGDLGNIVANDQGSANGSLVVHGPGPNLYFPTCIGRAVVIHAKEDDMGRGNNEESKKTGNSGSRIACCIIALAKAESPPPHYPPHGPPAGPPTGAPDHQAPHPMRGPPMSGGEN